MNTLNKLRNQLHAATETIAELRRQLEAMTTERNSYKINATVYKDKYEAERKAREAKP